MNYLKKLKELLKRGFASAEEKAALAKELEEQTEEVQEVAKEYLDKVNDLPEGENVDEEVEKAIKSVFENQKTSLTKSVKSEVISEVEKLLEKHKSQMERKVGVYAKEEKKDNRKVLNSYLREGLKSILSGSDTKEFEAVRKEMTTDSTGTPYAGYLTDDLLSAEIRHLVTEYGVAAREFTTVTFSQSSYSANNLVTDVSTFWVDEGGAISSTQAVLGQTKLELKKLAAIVTLTRELLQEQEIDFVSFLGSRVAEGFAKAEDQAFFIGDGTPTYGSFTGLLNNTNLNKVTMASGDGAFTDLSVKYLRDMQDATPQGAHANAKYYIHRSILNIVRNLREDAVSAGDGAGAYLVKQPMGDVAMNIDGYPIELVEAMPASSASAVDTAFVLFGDLRQAAIRGVRGGIQVDRFPSGSVRNVADSADINLITTDREAIRWINQVGYIAILPTAVTRLVTNSVSA